MGKNKQFHNFSIFSIFFGSLKKSIVLYLDERPGKTVEALNSMPQQVVYIAERSIVFSYVSQSCVVFIQGVEACKFVRIDEASKKACIYTILILKRKIWGKKCS